MGPIGPLCGACTEKAEEIGGWGGGGGGTNMDMDSFYLCRLVVSSSVKAMASKTSLMLLESGAVVICRT